MASRAHGATAGNLSLIGPCLALAGTVFIAAGVILASSSQTGPFATAFWRMALGCVFCAAMSRAVNGPGALAEMARLLVHRDAWIAGLAFAAVVALWYSGMRLSSPATTSALHNLSPLVLALCAWVFCAERPHLRKTLGILAAVAGMVVLTGHSGMMSDRALSGDLLALASAGFLALYYVRLTAMSRGLHPWTVMAPISLIAAPPLLLLSLATEPAQIPPAPEGWVLLVALAVATQVLGQSCLAQASRRLGAFGVTSVTLTEPAFTALMAALVLATPIYDAQVFGIAMIAAGLWVMLKPPARHHAALAGVS